MNNGVAILAYARTSKDDRRCLIAVDGVLMDAQFANHMAAEVLKTAINEKPELAADFDSAWGKLSPRPRQAFLGTSPGSSSASP